MDTDVKDDRAGPEAESERSQATQPLELAVSGQIEEIYFNSVRVNLGVHDMVIELLRDGPAPGTDQVEHRVVGRLRSSVSAAWALGQVIDRLVTTYAAQRGVFPLPNDYLDATQLREAYQALLERTRH